MAIENNDLFVLQKSGGGELRKATVGALIASLPTNAPTLDEVTTAGNNSETAITIGPDGFPTLELKEDGGITGKSLDIDNAVTAGTSISPYVIVPSAASLITKLPSLPGFCK